MTTTRALLAGNVEGSLADDETFQAMARHLLDRLNATK